MAADRLAAIAIGRRLCSPPTSTDALDLPQWWNDTLRHPWMWWQFLTCGFVHDPCDIQHILFNMLTLFFLGRDVEEWYGTREFIRLYLVMLVFSSVVWAVANRLFDPHQIEHLVRGLGGDCRRRGALRLELSQADPPVHVRASAAGLALGALAIAYDICGAMGRGDQHVAYTAHLGGAAFALAYFNLRWNFGQLLAVGRRLAERPFAAFAQGLQARGSSPTRTVADEDVDRILEKIHREGENSLTRKERRILEKRQPRVSAAAAGRRNDVTSHLPNRSSPSLSRAGPLPTSVSIIPCTSLVTFDHAVQPERAEQVRSNRTGRRESRREWPRRSGR